MLRIEMWINKNKWKLIGLLLLMLAMVINPYKIYNDNKIRVLNGKRIVIENEFLKPQGERDNKVLAKELNYIERNDKDLFMAILINNSFKTNEYESLKEQKEIYKSIKDKAIKNIIDIEVAIKAKDINKLRELYDSIKDRNLRDYILYIMKNIDTKIDINFNDDSIIKELYIG